MGLVGTFTIWLFSLLGCCFFSGVCCFGIFFEKNLGKSYFILIFILVQTMAIYGVSKLPYDKKMVSCLAVRGVIVR